MTSKKKLNIENRVRQYCEQKGIDRNRFMVLCLESPLTTETGRALTPDKVTKIYNGDTAITLQTAGLIAAALQVDLSEIFIIK